MSNIIDAIINLVNNPILELTSYYLNNNRANSSGDSLEEYVKELFSNSFNLSTKQRLEKWEETFSYLGNKTNPPDIMLKNGDAIEVKKIENNDSALALNSSYPKHTLKSNSKMISKACRSSENWIEKDIIYIVGVVIKNRLKSMSMVYGVDFCASEECYIKIKDTIKKGVESINNIEFSETKELGRINRVDPLGITYLRVRGMWGIENPWKVFKYVYLKDLSKKFNFMCLINNEKWNSFSNTKELESLVCKTVGLEITDVKIKNPDNPAQLKSAKLITFAL